MFGKHRCLFLLPALFVAGPACNDIQNTSDVQHARMDETRWAPRPHLAYMVDNGMMHDMALADIHFVPHTAELSGTGTARLDRLSVLLDAYGGVIRYETFLTDEILVQQRLAHVREYLETIDCDVDRVKVRALMSGGRGMPGDEALTAREKAAAESAGQGAAGAGTATSFTQGAS